MTPDPFDVRWEASVAGCVFRSVSTTHDGRAVAVTEKMDANKAVIRWLDGDETFVRTHYRLVDSREEYQTVSVRDLSVCGGHLSEVFAHSAPSGLVVTLFCDEACADSGRGRRVAEGGIAADAAITLLADTRGREALKHTPHLRRLMEEGTDR